MANFSLNVTKVNDSIDKFCWNEKYYSDNIDNIHSSLKNNLLKSWNDENAKKFIQLIKKNEYAMSEYLINLKSNLEIISDFNNKIMSICFEYGYKLNSFQLSFYDKNLSYINSNFNKAILYLNDIMKIIDNNLLIAKLDDLSFLNDLKSNIVNLKNNISFFKDNLNSFCKKINLAVNDVQYNMGLLDENVLCAKKIDFYSNFQSFDLLNFDIKSKNVNFNALNSKEANKIIKFENKNDLGKQVYIKGEEASLDYKSGSSTSLMPKSVDIVNSKNNQINVSNSDYEINSVQDILGVKSSLLYEDSISNNIKLTDNVGGNSVSFNDSLNNIDNNGVNLNNSFEENKYNLNVNFVNND